MKYFYDTEFLEDGSTIDLISIGIVCEDGREYYAVNADMDTDRIVNDKWLKENVWPRLPIQWNGDHPMVYLDKKSALVKPKWVIANEVREFLLDGYVPSGVDGMTDDETPIGTPPELWAYYGAYDHIALMQLWGKMINKPKGIPMWTHELMQLIEDNPDIALPQQLPGQHNALQDARWNWLAYNRLPENRS